MGEGERSLCLQAGGCRDSDGTKTCVLQRDEEHGAPWLWTFTFTACSGNNIRKRRQGSG